MPHSLRKIDDATIVRTFGTIDKDERKYIINNLAKFTDLGEHLVIDHRIAELNMDPHDAVDIGNELAVIFAQPKAPKVHVIISESNRFAVDVSLTIGSANSDCQYYVYEEYHELDTSLLKLLTSTPNTPH